MPLDPASAAFGFLAAVNFLAWLLILVVLVTGFVIRDDDDDDDERSPDAA